MPKNKTPNARVNAAGRRKGRARDADRATRGLRTVHEGGRTTHVLVPIEEYERLTLAAMARDAERSLADPATKWTDLEDFAAQVAGDKLAAARKARGLTQTELGKKLGMPQAQVSRIERNPDRTTLATLKRIARALRVDISKLVG